MNKSKHLKKELISALRSNLGIVSNACEALSISRTTYYKYYNEDSEFRSEVDNVGDSTLDFVEGKLYC
jgi:ACT domain-containing protein